MATVVQPQNVLVNAGNADNEIVAAVSGYKIRVLGYVLAGAGTFTATWKSASTAKSGAMNFIAASNITAPVIAPLDGSHEVGWFETAAGEALVLTATGGITGHLLYRLVPA